MPVGEFADRCAVIARAALGHGDLDAAIADIQRLPEFPGRGALAAQLIHALLVSEPFQRGDSLRGLGPLLALADADPPPGAEWPRLRAGARACVLARAGADRELADPRAALDEVDRLEREADGHPLALFFVRAARSGIAVLSSVLHNDVTLPNLLTAEMEQMRQAIQSHQMGPLLGEFLDAATGVLSGDRLDGDARAAMERMVSLASRLPEGSELRTSVERAAVMMGPLYDSGPSFRVTEEQLTTMERLATGGDLGLIERGLYHAQIGMTALGAGNERDPDRIARAVEHLRAAVGLTPLGHPHRPMVLQGLALALVRRNELTNSLADLDEAIALLEEAIAAAGGPRHPQWSYLNEMLAHAQRRRGVTNPHLRALDGLRANTWRVLLQPDLASASVAARQAATGALDVARLCLADSHPADAMRALDLGRGLALYAATARHDIPARLMASGRPELAERWSTADAELLPQEVRREILGVLTADGASAQLLEPPTMGEIREALATLGADALVYLMPAAPPNPGHAIVVPVAGRVAYLSLPNLTITDELAVEQFLAATSARDLTAAPSVGLPASVERICGWAWQAAIGPLFERYLAGLYPDGDRTPRVVLIPTGELARIPWQAARRADGTYAVELMALSQAVSARLLCRTARLAPIPASPVGLVVGDPDTGVRGEDLPAARLEAYAIHRRFYYGGRYLGRRPDGRPSGSGAGTATQVRGWLTDSGPAAGTTLHFACHGFVSSDPGSATSYLLLERGDPRPELLADEVVELLAGVPERALGLVVLAACRTGESMNGYDEAYSLGTAFLAGGARSVLSTQWRIPDHATSALMYMFHHYLMAEGRTAWDALRRAQLWMLDPDRRLPEHMPGPLRDQVIEARLGDVVAWAGFVHWGQ